MGYAKLLDRKSQQSFSNQIEGKIKNERRHDYVVSEMQGSDGGEGSRGEGFPLLHSQLHPMQERHPLARSNRRRSDRSEEGLILPNFGRDTLPLHVPDALRARKEKNAHDLAQ